MKRIIFMIFLNLEFIKCTQFSMRTEAIETRANRVITRTLLCGILEKLTDPKKSNDERKTLFGECPADHPFAYKFGKMCCDSLKIE